jgi:CRP-like cAMP-binding protein
LLESGVDLVHETLFLTKFRCRRLIAKACGRVHESVRFVHSKFIQVLSYSFAGDLLMESLECPAGSVIYKAGDPASKAFLIQQGTVELRPGDANSIAHEAPLGPGDVFGEMSLIDDQPHLMSALAISAVQLSVLTRDEFELLLSGVPVDYSRFLNSLFHRLKNLVSKPQDVPHSFAEKLAGRRIDVIINPLTRRAAATLPVQGIFIEKFPFRIGRAAGLNEDVPKDSNDLWLKDEIPFNISRNHAQIERDGDEIVVTDRGSSLGMYVNEIQIGGRSRHQQIVLEEGDNIVILGNPMSPYQFRVCVEYF